MAGFVLRSSILNSMSNVLFVLAFAMFSACVQPPVALAQHVGGHPVAHSSGGGRMAAPTSRPTTSRTVISRPTTSRPAIARTHAFSGGPRTNAGARSFRVPMRPGFGRRRPAFAGPPFFRFAGPRFLSFDSFVLPVWPACGYLGTWEFGCGAPAFYGTGFENYVTVPAYVNLPYSYSDLAPDQVWLYLSDGTVYSVVDYWFVNGQIHFTVADDPGADPAEMVMEFDQLDVQKTIDVNTRRGFRLVMRDAPWEKYLHDHPDAIPPPLPPPTAQPPQNK
jgi:hypothetical protein